MAPTAESHALRTLLRNLVLVIVLGTALFLVFTVFNHRLLSPFTAEEVLLLEAAAIFVVAYAAAQAFTSAADEILSRRGQQRHGATIRIFLNLLVAIGAILALFELAGVSAQSIFLGSAFAGIVLGLAAQTVLANVFAGLLLVVANPFLPGDRVSFISSSYGAFPPSYPHELMYPSYSGTVEDVSLLYTILRLDAGGIAKVPNSVVLGALVLMPTPGVAKAHRVRMTFPWSVSVGTVEKALAGVTAAFPGATARTPPRLEVVDISVASWDGLIILWSTVLDDGLVRDRVMREVLASLATVPASSEPSGAAPAPRDTVVPPPPTSLPSFLPR